MNTGPLPVILEPALVEEVVLRAIAGHRHEGVFRGARNRLYLLAEGDEREHSFREHHASWFTRLGLERPITAALAELPILAQHCGRCLVTRASTRHEEGADLLVAGEAGKAPQRTVLIRLRPVTFDDLDRLLGFLRAETLHVADMVDPAFGYEPTLPLTANGPAHDQLLRARYRVLWDVSVAGRLVRRAVAAPDARERAYSAFAAAFPMLEGDTEDGFARFFSGKARTHADILEFALAPGARHAASGLVPGGRCPLCRFPTYAPAPAGLPGATVARVRADFPMWRPADGLCQQCADLYRARAVAPPRALGPALIS